MKLLCCLLSVLAVAAVVRAAPVREDTFKCDGCKLGFWALEELVFNNKSETEVKWLFGEVCNLMPDPYKTACHTVIDSEIHELIEMIKTIETPEEICIQIGACNSTLPVPDVPCAICEFLMTDLERWIKENKTMTEIETLIDSICLLMPSSWEPACKQLADTGVETLVELLLKYENPKVVCEQITLCPGDYMSSMIAFGCEACELLWDSLEGWVAANKTETEIDWLLDRLCQLMPQTGKDICDRIIDMGVKEAVALLKEVESPYEICRQMGACFGPAPEDPTQCHICKFLVKDLEGWIEDGKTVSEIEKLVNGLCELMVDGEWAVVCDTIADVSIEVLIELLAKYETPAVVCEQIKLCTVASE